MTTAGKAVARVESIDVLRGINILVMIFVNDLEGVTRAPTWMQHISPGSADGMTFVDVVFPAFLFIVGMSIPFAVDNRLRHDRSLSHLWKHILLRTAALLTIGFFMVNTGHQAADGPLSPLCWALLMYLGVVLAWNVVPNDPGPKRTLMRRLRVAGAFLLVALAFLYRGTEARGVIELRPRWWGIIGLIGWAYLTACLAYIPLRNRRTAIAAVVVLLYGFFLATQNDFFNRLAATMGGLNLGVIFGTHGAIALSGVLLGMALRADSPVRTHSERIRWGILYGFGLASAALILHAFNDASRDFIYNKIAATPPWGLLSSAFTVWIWVLVYWLIDVKGWKRWAEIVKPASNNSLFAYVLAPIVYKIFALLAIPLGFNFYDSLGASFAVGFWRALISAFALTWLAGWLSKRGVWLRI